MGVTHYNVSTSTASIAAHPTFKDEVGLSSYVAGVYWCVEVTHSLKLL